MDIKAIENELIILERRYWQSMKDKDATAANRLTDYPCLIVGAQGVGSIDGAKTYSSMLDASDWTLQDFDLEDGAQVRLISNDVAIVAYKVREKLTVDDKPVMFEAADASVWVRRDGHWRCAMHTESLAGDPFGRDRRSIH